MQAQADIDKCVQDYYQQYPGFTNVPNLACYSKNISFTPKESSLKSLENF